MKLTYLALCLALVLAGCGDGRAPTELPTIIIPTATPPPVAPPTTAPTAAPTEAPTATAEVPTAIPPTETPTETLTSTPSPIPRPRATGTPAAPLDFQMYVAGCRDAPTAGKPDNVVITISVEATGGNGAYRYYHRDVEEPDKFIDIEWGKNTRLNGSVTVTSGDGQSLAKEYDIRPSDHCP